jgi:hypothetical protein
MRAWIALGEAEPLTKRGSNSVSIPTAGDAINAVLNAFQPFVPTLAAGLPKASLSIARAVERPAGIGNVIGIGGNRSIAAPERRAIRIEATARFAVWGSAVADVDAQLTALSAKILARRDELAANGFMKLSLGASASHEYAAASNAWSACADYEVLFELPYEDTGDATSLILPVDAAEAATGAAWSVTADYARWDDVAALPLLVRGPARIVGLAALSFLGDPANPPTGAVTMTRTYDGAAAPANAPSFDAFILAVSGAQPVRNIAVSFASISDLFARLTPEPDLVSLGNALGTEDAYAAAHLTFSAPLSLGSIVDRFDLSYVNGKFDRRVVVYLRALRAGG